jgi:hypothetical protein
MSTRPQPRTADQTPRPRSGTPQAKVTRSALQNAASIAALFLTTAVVIVDKPERNSAGAGPNMGGMDF